jgi:RimJ/RimL family protein N-acetyltransferase
VKAVKKEARDMGNLRDYRAVEQLKNGLAVTIRAIRTDDRDRIVNAFGNLERESVYTRLFRYKDELTEKDLKSITEVDFENVVALVVTKGEGDDETIIGGGRYMAYNAPGGLRNAEVAFIVEEDYHGLGIASRILSHLTAIGRSNGIAAFEADVLTGNKGMLRVFAKSGLPMKQKPVEDVMHVTLSLTGSV